MKDIRLEVEPEFASYGPNERAANLVARVIPPETVDRDRQPATVVFALDTSGSMQGHKLASAVECAAAFASALGPADKVSLVTFDSHVSIVVDPCPAHDPSFGVALTRIRAEGRTFLSEGLEAALFVAGRQPPPVRVILLTDGCPNKGLTEPSEIVAMLEQKRGDAIVSALGYGDDVDPLLLQELTTSGRGNYAFVEAGEPPVAAMGGELGALLSTAGSDVVLSIRPGEGTHVEKVFRSRAPDRVDGASIIKLPDLIAAEPAIVGFRIGWDAGVTPELSLSAMCRPAPCAERREISCSVRPAIGARKGGLNPQAVTDLILCRISEQMFRLARVRDAQVDAMAREAERLEAETDTLATIAGVREQLSVVAALQMLRLSLEGLLSRAERNRLQTVARGAALQNRRAVSGGRGFDREEHTMVTNTQILGMEEMLRRTRTPDGQGN